MAILTDRKERNWTIELDALLVEDVEKKWKVKLTSLENDPLRFLRDDPMCLVGVVSILCDDQIAKLDCTPEDCNDDPYIEFGKNLPSADNMLEAIADAIVNFFPSGRHSHVREVLTEFAKMSETTDALALLKMQEILKDPNTPKRLDAKADKEMQKKIDEMFPLAEKLGTDPIAGQR